MIKYDFVDVSQPMATAMAEYAPATLLGAAAVTPATKPVGGRIAPTHAPTTGAVCLERGRDAALGANVVVELKGDVPSGRAWSPPI